MRLEDRIKRDMKEIGMKTDFHLELRGFSKTLEGTYNPNTFTLVVYVREIDGMLLDYSKILEVAIHEGVHHMQWKHDPAFVRKKGIMHNADFYRMYNGFIAKAKLGGKYVETSEKPSYKDMEKNYRLII